MRVCAMTWDGEGTDPWLPERLGQRSIILQTEQAIRDSFWAALSRWLVQTARRVLRTGRPPDLDAVWARVPAWHEAVDLVVYGEIRKAVGAAYEALFGKDYPWAQRRFVVVYLAEVRNRLVRVPNEIYDLIAGQVSQGVNLGEGIPKLAARVDSVLSTTQSERWPNRATVVARTETIGARNAGRYDAFRAMAEEADEELEKLWLATSDNRTRPTHRLADGQRVPLDGRFNVGGFELAFPGDPSGPAQEVIQCRCTMLLVEPGENVDMSNRQFRRGR
jgi:hypothetical protein